jgi:branched-chain amino acid transport system substrate-binding protein
MRKVIPIPGLLSGLLALTLLASACVPGGPGTTAGQKPSELKIAMVDFMSGGAAKFGTAALNAGELALDQINAQGGIGGVQVKHQKVDENGPVDQVVTNYRRLVTDEKVDAVLGYTSSANCLAVAPVADELKKLTIIHICGTYRLFEDAQRKYVVRAASHGVTDSVASALYAITEKPDLKTVAAINDDYAWGRDSWELFSHALKKVKPDVQILEDAVLWPKAFIGEYSAELTKLEAARPDIIHTSLWGGHMDSFIKQAQARGLFQKSLVLMTTGETALLTLSRDVPQGIAMTGRGQYMYIPEPEKNELNRKFIADYSAKHNEVPVYPAYRMVQAVYGYKNAVEKAMKAKNGAWPNQDEVVAAFKDLDFETPTGPIKITSAQDANQQAVYGLTSGRPDPRFGFPLLEKVQTWPATVVNPPPGKKTLEWIDSEFKKPS